MTGIVLGAFPWLVKIFSLYIIIGTVSFDDLLIIDDIMFFIIILTASTIINTSRSEKFDLRILFILASLLIWACIIIGFYQYFKIFPSSDAPYEPIFLRLKEVSIILLIFTILVNIIIIIFFHYKNRT